MNYYYTKNGDIDILIATTEELTGYTVITEAQYRDALDSLAKKEPVQIQ
jgi:hypothetical protein